jgi:asparagine synthase (glutamine-hydrolysing)
MNRSPASVPAFAKAFFEADADLADPVFSHRPRWRNGASLLRLLSPEFGAPQSTGMIDDILSATPTSFFHWSPLEQAQYLEMRTLLPGYILAPQGDRMLMGHSVEGRFPFLDHRLVEFAASLPPDQKIRDLDEKHILKRAVGDLVPGEVLTRPKQPYRAPDAAVFISGGSVLGWVRDLLCDANVQSSGVFQVRAVQGLLNKCERTDGVGMSNADNMRIVSVVSTMLLHDQFISRRDAIDHAVLRRDSVNLVTADA